MLSPANNTPPKAVVFGCSGLSLTEGEKQFFRYANPFGFILFQRNCASPDQVRTLIKELRAAIGRPDAPVMIDQEGGRVLRLKPPHWPSFPAAQMFGNLYARDPGMAMEAASINARLMAFELYALGFSVNCAPLADVTCETTDPAIGDRAYSNNPQAVSDCARATAEGFMNNGVLPMIKHLPGHGRAQSDPHEGLAVVTASREELAARDFIPFKAMRDLPMAMTCHINFTALDDQRPASVSSKVHEVIRNEIGFDGFLLSDDIGMKGLQGRLEDLVVQTIQAGSDCALHCNGSVNEMAGVASNAPVMTEKALFRWQHALGMKKAPPSFIDRAELTDRLDMLLGVAATGT